MKYSLEEKREILQKWHKAREGGLDSRQAAEKIGHHGAQMYAWQKQLRDAGELEAPDNRQETLPEMPPLVVTDVVTEPEKKTRKKRCMPQLMEIPVDDGEDRVQVVMVNGSSRHVESVMQTIASIFRR